MNVKEEFAIPPQGDAIEPEEVIVAPVEGSAPSEVTPEEVVIEETQEEVEEESFEIDGQNYSASELEQLLLEGAKVREYKKEHPGWDPALMHKDYTKKAMDLADAKKRLAQIEASSSQPKPTVEPDLLTDVNPADIAIIEKVLQAKGYVKKDDLLKESYETTKKKQVSAFIEKHPEYHPNNDSDDANWNTLKTEFDLFKLPQDPAQIEALLERAHKNVSGVVTPTNGSAKLDIQKAQKILAQRKVNKVGQSTSSGASGAGKARQATPDKLKRFLKGFSDEELQEFVN